MSVFAQHSMCCRVLYICSTTSIVFDELDHVASLELTEAGLRCVSPRDVIQCSEAVLAHRVDVVLSF